MLLNKSQDMLDLKPEEARMAHAAFENDTSFQTVSPITVAV